MQWEKENSNESEQNVKNYLSFTVLEDKALNGIY